MTEAEWLACEDPKAMELSIAPSVSPRKGRLYVCACCRHIWDYIVENPRMQEAVEVAETLADGNADAKLVRATRRRAKTAASGGVYDVCNVALASVAPVVRFNGYLALTAANHTDSEFAPYCALLRDIFGNPFRPVAFSPDWRTDAAVALARRMYEARDFSAMPILADALQDTGCDSAAILDHSRGPGPHVRGCWVVDLVLGKE
jgi:hypothetical protein